MKKISLLFVLFAFFAFGSLTSCKQKPAATETTEEVAPAEDVTPAEEAPADTAAVEAAPAQ